MMLSQGVGHTPSTTGIYTPAINNHKILNLSFLVFKNNLFSIKQKMLGADALHKLRPCRNIKQAPQSRYGGTSGELPG